MVEAQVNGAQAKPAARIVDGCPQNPQHKAHERKRSQNEQRAEPEAQQEPRAQRADHTNDEHDRWPHHQWIMRRFGTMNMRRSAGVGTRAAPFANGTNREDHGDRGENERKTSLQDQQLRAQLAEEHGLGRPERPG